MSQEMGTEGNKKPNLLTTALLQTVTGECIETAH